MSTYLRTSPIGDTVIVMTSTQDYREAVAGEVRAALARAGRSSSQVSEATGIPSSTLSRKMRALSPFTVDELARVASALDIDPSEFFAPRAISHAA